MFVYFGVCNYIPIKKEIAETSQVWFGLSRGAGSKTAIGGTWLLFQGYRKACRRRRGHKAKINAVLGSQLSWLVTGVDSTGKLGETCQTHTSEWSPARDRELGHCVPPLAGQTSRAAGRLWARELSSIRNSARTRSTARGGAQTASTSFL